MLVTHTLLKLKANVHYCIFSLIQCYSALGWSFLRTLHCSNPIHPKAHILSHRPLNSIGNEPIIYFRNLNSKAPLWIIRLIYPFFWLLKDCLLWGWRPKCVWLFCNPMDYDPPDSSGSLACWAFQARILKRVAISFSAGFMNRISNLTDSTPFDFPSPFTILSRPVQFRSVASCVHSL